MADNGVKLQINSLEALERLIGGDSEFEIELRRSVADRFIRNHSEAITREFAQQGLGNTVEKFIKDNFIMEVREGGGMKKYLKDELRKLIEQNVKAWVEDTVKSEIKQAVTDAWNQAVPQVTETVNKAMAELVMHFANKLAPEVKEKAITAAILKRLALPENQAD